MPLSRQQQQALPHCEWLISNHSRRSGRSYLLAVAAIREACRYPGEEVVLFDHYPTQRMVREFLVTCIQALVHNDPVLSPRVQISQGKLRINLPQPIPNWLPSDTGATFPLEGELPTRKFPKTALERILAEDFL